MKIIAILLSVIILNNYCYAQHNIDSTIVEGVLVQSYYSTPKSNMKKVVIDTESDIFFIPNKNINKKDLINISKDVNKYESSRNQIFLIWDNDAEAFFKTFSLANTSKSKKLKWSLNTCSTYKLNGRKVRTVACKFKALYTTTTANFLKKQVILNHNYAQNSSSVKIYLFYELIENKCIQVE